jgi:iron complex outermembrane receptor protein
MVKPILLSLVINLLHCFSFGQTPIRFDGSVVDNKNKPVIGARVLLKSLNKADVSNAQGDFSIDDLTQNTFVIEISCIGYETLIQRIELTENKKYIFQLEAALVKLDGVVVEGNYVELKKEKTSLNIEIVNDDYLRQNLGGSLMKSLERLPGLSTIDIGSGQSKPVIRGLGFNRVVVVENSIKHEAQQWGADHGLEIDQYAIDRIEIIKGPASLMYGSDAIGGIIDLKNKTVPKENTFGGSVDLSGKTNNDFIGSSVSFFARKKDFFATVRATILDYGDYRVPTDRVAIYSYYVPLHNNQLRNTAGNEQNLHTSFGLIKDRFKSTFYVSNVHTKYGFFANAHGLEPRNVDRSVHDQSNRDILYPYQEVNHFKVINKSMYNSKNWKFESDLGYQRNYREEWSQYAPHGYMPAVFPKSLDFNPELERQFEKDIYSVNAKLFYNTSDKTQVSTGINAEYKENNIGGRGFIIPAYQHLNLGSFMVAKYNYSKKSLFQAGIRYDHGNVNVSSYNDWFVSPNYENGDTTQVYLKRADDIERNFSNLSWSIGYNYNPDNWSYKFNLGKSFRIPIAKELAASGVNYHRFSYEVGNASLSPEVSYQLDAGVEYHAMKFAVGVSPFFNYFSNYIYLNPTSRYDRLYGFGNQVFEYTESEILRYGGELHAHYEASKQLRFGFIGEYVYAEQLSGPKKGYTLPFAPPASAILNVKYQKSYFKFLTNAYLSLDYKFTAAQNNIVPPEVTTDGYQVFNFSLGGDLVMHNQKISIAMQVQNLLNSKYFNHTSYYRLINVPEAGRNFIINISIPFMGNLKHN